MIKALFFCMLALLAEFAYGHAGSPWHGTGGSVALGLNSVYLQIPDNQPSAKFTIKYPIQENTFDYRVGDTSSVVIFSNEELQKQGFITEKSAVLAVDNGPYNPNQPSEYEFTITKSGYYHLLFGPGPNTSLLVVQTARTFDVVAKSDGAKVGQYLSPTTSGDFHIVKHPTLGLTKFAGWYSVFYKEYTDAYRKAGLPVATDMDLVGDRGTRFAAALAERGYPQFATYKAGQSVTSSPFLARVNGLSSEAFDTAHLTPGEYIFRYSPAKITSSIIQTNEISLGVFPDQAFKKEYGIDQDMIVRKTFIANQDKYELRFKVEQDGFYHLTYAAGEGGFIFSMVPDESIPTEIEAVSGTVISHTRLTGVNSTIISSRPLVPGEWSVFFPCKVVQAKTHGAEFLSKVTVPFRQETRLAVARFGSAIMLPLTSESLRIQIENQRKQILMLKSAPVK
jgi:hypothetical protein